jgi:hypothetical protein
MTLRSTFVRLLVCVVAVAAFVALAFVLKRGQGMRGKRLPDGSVLTIRHLSVTNSHSWNPRAPWKQRLERWIPPRFDWILGPPNPGCGMGSAEEGLGVWTTCFDPVSRSYRPLDSTPRFELVDEHGCIFPGGGRGRCSGGRSPAQAFVVNCFMFEAFPRRAATFAFRLYATNGTVAAEVELENPRRSAFPVWQPESLPATRTNRDLRFRLSEIAAISRTQDAQERPRFTYLPKFDITADGRTASDWALDTFTFADATGNHGGNLCPYEPAWKLEATFFRTSEATYATNEAWRLEKLSVPAPGETALLGTRGQAGDVRIELVAVSGSGRYAWSNGVCVAAAPLSAGETDSAASEGGVGYQIARLSRSKPHLVMRITQPNPDGRILLRGQDDQRRRFYRNRAEAASGLYIYNLDAPDEAKTVDVELIAQKPLKFEYLVKPPRP